jgi:hypothetical protein
MAGVIDADYRGAVGVILANLSDADFEVKIGDRIAQLIVEKVRSDKTICTRLFTDCHRLLCPRSSLSRNSKRACAGLVDLAAQEDLAQAPHEVLRRTPGRAAAILRSSRPTNSFNDERDIIRAQGMASHSLCDCRQWTRGRSVAARVVHWAWIL